MLASQREGEEKMNKATEAMCDAARPFIIGMEIGIKTFEFMKDHLEEYEVEIPHRIVVMAKDYPKSHITKWDKAEIIYDLMEKERVRRGK